ncbi:MAG TPA: hypothetical protein VJ845_03195 [Haploplasma sp.]|nr:hypothetical protein [Haploplasma sp.]
MFDDRGVIPGLQIAKIITNLVLIAVVIWLEVIVYDLGNKISENPQIPSDSIPWEPIDPSVPKDETIPWTPLEPSIPNEEDDTEVFILSPSPVSSNHRYIEIGVLSKR